jgi:hypothetical protein
MDEYIERMLNVWWYKMAGRANIRESRMKIQNDSDIWQYSLGINVKSDSKALAVGE